MEQGFTDRSRCQGGMLEPVVFELASLNALPMKEPELVSGFVYVRPRQIHSENFNIFYTFFEGEVK